MSESSQYVTFKLGDELFGIDVKRVREVLDLSQITRVPGAPGYMRGVVNLRGQAIAVVDLRVRLGLPRVPDTVYSRIIVMELQLDGELAFLGGVADSVHEVIDVDPTQMNEPPRIAVRWRSEFIQAITRREDEFLILLDLNCMFSALLAPVF